MLLVHVNQHATLDRVPRSRALDLTWLKDHTTIREEDRLAPMAKMGETVALQSPQIVRIAEVLVSTSQKCPNNDPGFSRQTLAQDDGSGL